MDEFTCTNCKTRHRKLHDGFCRACRIKFNGSLKQCQFALCSYPSRDILPEELVVFEQTMFHSKCYHLFLKQNNYMAVKYPAVKRGI